MDRIIVVAVVLVFMEGVVMVDDLINRADLLEALNNIRGCGGIYLWNPEDVLATVEKAPAVEADPVVHAHWVYKIDDWYCSHCDGVILKEVEVYGGGMFRDTNTVHSPYCPHCGAHMDEEVADA